MPPCEKCHMREKVPGERFCRDCRGVLLLEMKRAGYLTTLPRPDNRSRECWEDERETREGRDG